MKDNSCPYILAVTDPKFPEIYNVYKCSKERHSHGDHESPSGVKWYLLDSRERPNHPVTSHDVSSRMG